MLVFVKLIEGEKGDCNRDNTLYQMKLVDF